MKSTEFKKIVTKRLAPYLRDNGWKGTGFNFLKQNDTTTQVLTIQPSGAGGKFCVEIGVFFHFMADYTNKEPSKLKTWDLEFRTRLAPANESDHWWDFPKSESAEDGIFESIIDLLETTGKDYFDSYSDWKQNFKKISPEDIEDKRVWTYIPLTKIRTALFLARFHDHHENLDQIRPLAEYGLAQVDGRKGSALIAEFNKLIKKSS